MIGLENHLGEEKLGSVTEPEFILKFEGFIFKERPQSLPRVSNQKCDGGKGHVQGGVPTGRRAVQGNYRTVGHTRLRVSGSGRGDVNWKEARGGGGRENE